MPNHVHLLIAQIEGWPLGTVLDRLKGYTAYAANRHLGRRGPFWQRNYFDTYIRNEAHFGNVVDYIHNNPVKAGLVLQPEDWRWSSAGCRLERRPSGECHSPLDTKSLGLPLS